MNAITACLGDLEEERLLELVEQAVANGVDPKAILDAAREGMDIVGARFSSGYYFVCELACSAELFRSIMKVLGPQLAVKQDGPQARVVLGTVQGDIHNIGKDLVAAMLAANGFDVHDVGIDIPPQVFVDKVQETGATILGLSGLLTVAFPAMEATIRALDAAGLRGKVKVMIGGGMVDDLVCSQVGADAWGRDAMHAVELAKSFAAGVEK